MDLLQILFWLSCVVLLYVYAGYPFLIYCLSKLFHRPYRISLKDLPAVSMVIAAYNEVDAIAEKLWNTLALDYPAEKLEIIVVSDGSDDGTDDVVRSFQDRGVRLIRVEPRRGKTHALNVAIPQASHPVVVLSDANAMYHPESLKQLVQYLADPTVGAVTGDVQIVNEGAEFGRSERLYYWLERAVQYWESQFASTIGVDGAMYALRKKAFVPPTNDIILDDFVISMNAIRKGYRVVYNPQAKAYENATPTVNQEINRKARIVAGGLQAFFKRQGLPRWFQWREWFMYISHKWLRWLTPVFLLVLFVSTILLAFQDREWLFILLAQLLFYGIAIWGWRLSHIEMPLLFKLAFYFCMINYAAALGIWRAITGQQSVTWKKAERYRIGLPLHG